VPIATGSWSRRVATDPNDGGSGGQAALEKRLTDLAAQENSATIQAGGNNCGWKFIPRIAGLKCYGARIYWIPGGANRTIRVRLIDAQSATVLATANVNILSGQTGIYSVTWPDVTLVAGKPTFVDAWQMDNIHLTYFTYADHGLDVRYGYWGPWIESAGCWFGGGVSGGAQTETTFGSPQVLYPVEPLIRPVTGG
jgi:hypothetical protein